MSDISYQEVSCTIVFRSVYLFVVHLMKLWTEPAGANGTMSLTRVALVSEKVMDDSTDKPGAIQAAVTPQRFRETRNGLWARWYQTNPHILATFQ